MNNNNSSKRSDCGSPSRPKPKKQKFVTQPTPQINPGFGVTIAGKNRFNRTYSSEMQRIQDKAKNNKLVFIPRVPMRPSLSDRRRPSLVDQMQNMGLVDKDEQKAEDQQKAEEEQNDAMSNDSSSVVSINTKELFEKYYEVLLKINKGEAGYDELLQCGRDSGVGSGSDDGDMGEIDDHILPSGISEGGDRTGEGRNEGEVDSEGNEGGVGLGGRGRGRTRTRRAASSSPVSSIRASRESIGRQSAQNAKEVYETGRQSARATSVPPPTRDPQPFAAAPPAAPTSQMDRFESRMEKMRTNTKLPKSYYNNNVLPDGAEHHLFNYYEDSTSSPSPVPQPEGEEDLGPHGAVMKQLFGGDDDKSELHFFCVYTIIYLLVLVSHLNTLLSFFSISTQ